MTIIHGHFARPQPSRSLSMEARERFRELADTRLVDFSELENVENLDNYMRLADELRDISRTLQAEGRYVRDAEGVLQAHPLVAVQHQARMAMLSLSDRLLANPEAREKAQEK